MRVVEYKFQDSDTFNRYVDIGYCERDYYFLCFYMLGLQEESSGKKYYSSYQDWYLDFKANSIGSQMLTLNYYLREYHEPEYKGPWIILSDPNYFKEVYGDKISKVISNNYDLIMRFNNKWFIEQSIIFSGLDLGWDDVDEEEELIRIEETEYGIKTEVEFSDGSIMRFLDADDKIWSFYVLENDFSLLKMEIENIVSLFE